MNSNSEANSESDCCMYIDEAMPSAAHYLEAVDTTLKFMFASYKLSI